jgi:prolyl oligopeptidase
MSSPLIAIAVFCAATVAACGPAPSRSVSYPPTRTVNVVDDYHGTKVADPYRWLEDLESKEVREWAAAQTKLFESIVRAHPSRAPLFERMNALGKVWDAVELRMRRSPSSM